MKNITATVITLAMLLGMTACGGENTNEPVTTGSTTVTTAPETTTATTENVITTVGDGALDVPEETTTAPVEEPTLPVFDINSEECLMYRLLDMTVEEIEAEFGELTMYGIIAEETVDIGGSEGRLFRRTQGGSLFWLREIDGIGFYLTSFDPDVDLIAMARSVSRCDPYGSAEADANTEAALLQLGDYSAAWLPQGFSERDIMGVPVQEGGWYGYVRRFYTDKETNREAVFWYEPFVVPPDAAAQDANEHFRSIHNEDAHVATTIDEASVNGHVAMIHVAPAMNSIHWLDAEQGLEFGISSSALTVEELVQMAESVASSESVQ